MVLNTKTKRPATTAHRKRHGQHHKQTKRYGKTYWPYLPLLLIVALGLVFNSLWSNAQHNVLGYATDMSASGLLQGTNTQRTGNSLGALALNSQLASAAQAKANDMASRDYWSHNTPDGATPWTFITNAGYSYQAAGENLAYGFTSSSDTITAWMNSAEHRANILNSKYEEVGFGIANSANYQGTGPETIVVAMYAKPAVVAPAPAPAPVAAKPAPAKQATPTPTPSAATPTANNNQSQPANNSSNPSSDNKTPNATKANSSAQKSDPGTTANSKTPKKQDISRIQLLSQGNAPWSAFAVSSLAMVCVIAFLLRHGLAWRRVLARSEVFLVKHHLLDIILVAIGVLGFILTRSAGAIH